MADVDAALYDDRSLVKQLAMRGTLSCSRAICCHRPGGRQRSRGRPARDPLAKEVRGAGSPTTVGAGSLPRAGRCSTSSSSTATPGCPRRRCASGCPSSGHAGGLARQALRRPDTDRSRGCSPSSGSRRRSCAAGNDGHWRISRPRWVRMDAWLDAAPAPAPAREGYAALVRGWLTSFGPGTRDDLRWWLGSTVATVTHALHDVGAVEVALDDGATGWMLPDHLDELAPARAVGRAAAGPRRDGDGLEGPRLLPRPAPAGALRPQRQRRHHRLVGRPGRGLLGAGPRRRRGGRAAGGPAGRGDGRAGSGRPTGSPGGWAASSSARSTLPLP